MGTIRVFGKFTKMKRAILLGSLATSAVVLLLVASQDRLIYMKRTYESHGLKQYYQNIRTHFDQNTGRMVLDVAYKTSFGMQTAFWIPPKGDAIQSGTFGKLWIVFGGNAQLALDWLWFVEKLGEPFYKDSFLLIDYPGYGNCGGDTVGSTTVLESVHFATESVIKMLYENHTNRIPDVGVLAHSLGCAAGLHFAVSSRYKVNHLVLSSPFASIPKMAEQIFVPTPLRTYPAVSAIFDSLISPRNRWNNIQAIDELAERAKNEKRTVKLVIFHGDDDEICPFEQGKSLHERMLLHQPHLESKFIAIRGGDHNGLIEKAFTKISKSLQSRL